MKGHTWEGHHTPQDTAITRFVARHPMWSSVVLFAALPLGLLAAVGGATSIVLLPLSIMLGWL